MHIDAHQHFWKYNPAHQLWMTNQMAVLWRDYLPDELQPLLASVGFDGTIAVQARQMLAETEWLLKLSDAHDFIKGIVGWVDLRSPNVRAQLAKPPIREGLVSPWREDLGRLAEFPNVFCKLSGLVTEAKWKQWRTDEFHRYLDIVVGAFGTDRVMIGSDWPVCTLSGDYVSTMRIVTSYVQPFAPDVREDILGRNCARFYHLKNTPKTP